MKHISDFNSYQVNEGWKENILVGLLSLFGAHAMGQKTNISQTKTKSEKSMQSLIKQG